MFLLKVFLYCGNFEIFFNLQKGLIFFLKHIKQLIQSFFIVDFLVATKSYLNNELVELNDHN